MGVWILLGLGLWGLAAGLVWALIYAQGEQATEGRVEA